MSGGGKGKGKEERGGRMGVVSCKIYKSKKILLVSIFRNADHDTRSV